MDQFLQRLLHGVGMLPWNEVGVLGEHQFPELIRPTGSGQLRPKKGDVGHRDLLVDSTVEHYDRHSQSRQCGFQFQEVTLERQQFAVALTQPTRQEKEVAV